MINKNTGINRIIKAISYSFKGIQLVWMNEISFRQEIFMLILAIIITIFLKITTIEFILLIGSIILIIIIELLNTAIEIVVNRISTEFHELSCKAKDIASSAVFISIILAIFIWITIISNHYLNLIEYL